MKGNKMAEKTKSYLFTIEFRGIGDNPDEAWQDACEFFALDPGSTPEEYKLDFI